MEKVFDLTAFVNNCKADNDKHAVSYELKILEDHDYNWTKLCQGKTQRQSSDMGFSMVDEWLVEPENFVELNDIEYMELLYKVRAEM